VWWLVTLVVFFNPFLGCRIPYHLIDLFVFKPIKYSVWADQDVVQPQRSIFFIDYFWITYDYTTRSTKMCKLCFTIAKSSANWQSAGKHAIWANKRIIFIIWIFNRRRFLLYLLRLCSWHSIFHYRLCLVDVTTGFNNAIKFFRVRRFMIVWHLSYTWSCFHLNSLKVGLCSVNLWIGWIYRLRCQSTRISNV